MIGNQFHKKRNVKYGGANEYWGKCEQHGRVGGSGRSPWGCHTPSLARLGPTPTRPFLVGTNE